MTWILRGVGLVRIHWVFREIWKNYMKIYCIFEVAEEKRQKAKSLPYL